MGAWSVTFTQLISATTVYCENVLVPMKCRSSLPLQVKRGVPSGITPLPCVARILPQRFVLPDLQNLHSRHSGVLTVGELLVQALDIDFGNVTRSSLKC